jgi:hypothetical protein
MPKKSKRPIRREANSVSEKSIADPLISSRSSTFNPDYHFVIRDIRRVGILAGSFIIILVVLSFFLH